MPGAITDVLLFAIPAVFAVTVHEVAHGWVANQLGDPTAARAGRLSLNPLKHVDLVGTVLVPAALIVAADVFFGWAKPVPVDWRNLRRVRRDLALVAIAGPLANLAMAAAWLALLAGCAGFVSVTGVGGALLKMCGAGIMFNATIMMLNLIPIPPLDGSRVLAAVLPARTARVYARVEPFGLALMLVLMFSGWLGAILGPGLNLVRAIIGAVIAVVAG